MSCATAGSSVTASGTRPGSVQSATALTEEAKKNLAGWARGEASARCIKCTAPRMCVSKLCAVVSQLGMSKTWLYVYLEIPKLKLTAQAFCETASR